MFHRAFFVANIQRSGGLDLKKECLGWFKSSLCAVNFLYDFKVGLHFLFWRFACHQANHHQKCRQYNYLNDQ